MKKRALAIPGLAGLYGFAGFPGFVHWFLGPFGDISLLKEAIEALQRGGVAMHEAMLAIAFVLLFLYAWVSRHPNERSGERGSPIAETKKAEAVRHYRIAHESEPTPRRDRRIIAFWCLSAAAIALITVLLARRPSGLSAQGRAPAREAPPAETASINPHGPGSLYWKGKMDQVAQYWRSTIAPLQRGACKARLDCYAKPLSPPTNGFQNLPDVSGLTAQAILVATPHGQATEPGRSVVLELRAALGEGSGDDQRLSVTFVLYGPSQTPVMTTPFPEGTVKDYGNIHDLAGQVGEDWVKLVKETYGP